MSSYTPLWLMGTAGFGIAVAGCYRKGRRAQAVLSVFLMLGALTWVGILIVGVGLGYNEEPDGPGLSSWIGMIAAGAVPILIAVTLPVVGALKPPVPDSRVGRRQIPHRHRPNRVSRDVCLPTTDC